MAEITDSTPLPTAGNTPDGDIKWVRSASDVSRLVNDGSQGRANARIVVGIALGGIFLDAYDLGALAFGIKDITREFNLTPAGTGMVASAIKSGATASLWPTWCSLSLPLSPVRWPRTNMCLRARAL